jgi:hypothetical protein
MRRPSLFCRIQQVNKGQETPVSKKPSIMTRTWAGLPATVTFEELYAAGWQGRFIDRAISRGWLVVHSTKDGCGAGYAACPPKNIIYGVAVQKVIRAQLP